MASLKLDILAFPDVGELNLKGASQRANIYIKMIMSDITPQKN
jgi:hypothetical protein